MEPVTCDIAGVEFVVLYPGAMPHGNSTRSLDPYTRTESSVLNAFKTESAKTRPREIYDQLKRQRS